ncbi:RNA recognition motif domain-containing protein [Ditylenchus destructor]|nr:RNA recognition motif domain-containing protein [Ditylenchus destructor]
MLSFFWYSRIHFNKISNTRRQLTSLSSIFPIQINVNHEVTRKLSLCKPLSGKFYSTHSKKSLTTANLTSQIYSRQNFSSSSSGKFGAGGFDEPDRKARTVMVAGLSKDTTEDSLRKYFSEKKCNVTDCRIIRDKMTGNSRKFGFVEFVTVDEAELASKRPQLIDSKEVNVIMSGNKDLHEKYRIFVGGLRKETLRSTLHRYFSQFGDIFECSIVRNEDNLSKGFGYVTYKSQDSVDRALNSKPHSIDNQVLTVRHASLRRRELTLFIGNLSPKTTDESLRKHFSRYGQLMDCEVKTDRQTGQSRGFGYVGYASKEELDRALDEQVHVIDGVEVKLNHKTHELDLKVDSLPRNMSEESLKKKLWDLFSCYGRVRNCDFIKNSAGNTTAFVQLSSKDEISRALNARPHWIDGKLVATRYQGEEFCLIVNGLPKDATDEDLYETFSKAGKLVHWEVKRAWKDKTNRPLGYGFVSFSTAEDIARAIDNQPYEINGTKLKIERRYDIYKTEK